MFRRPRSRRHRGEPNWARARRSLHAAFESTCPPGTQIEVGRAKFLSDNLIRVALGAPVTLDPDPEERSDAYVALIPQDRHLPKDYPELVRREHELLTWLADQPVELLLPRPVAVVEDRGEPVLVTSFVPGVIADLRAGRQKAEPWKLVAEVAATIHATSPPPSWAPRDRRAHRLEELAELDALEYRGPDVPELAEIADIARAWLRAHLGEPQPGVLLHGDIQGRNLYLGHEHVGVLEWVHASIGDPAADLALTTRGVRRPFQHNRGRQELLDAYATQAQTPVEADDLRFFEIALVTRWLLRSPRGEADLALFNQLVHLLEG